MRSVRIRTGLILGLLISLLIGCTPAPAKDAPVDSNGDGVDSDGDGVDSDADGVDADGDGSLADEDCDDGDPTRNPGASERCDEVDNDCDGETDEDAEDATTWYRDADADGYGTPDDTITTCDSPEGYQRYSKDCDDDDPTVHTFADELCDAVDNDCDGDVDEDTPEDATTWYQDQDGDGHGDGETATTACVKPDDSYIENGDDCDDLDDGVYPGAPEICEDGVVNDCDADAGDAVETCGLGGTADLTGADLTLGGEAIYDPLGYSVSSAGDVDGDGLVDLLIGCYSDSAVYTGSDHAYAGSAYLLLGGGSLSGATGNLGLDSAEVLLRGEASSDGLGRSVSSAGDVDGDGLDDLLVGAPKESEEVSTGAAYLLLAGGSIGLTSGVFGLEDADLKLSGEEKWDLAGSSLASAGDLDGDGLSDVLVGADGVGTFGAVYVVHGRESLTGGY